MMFVFLPKSTVPYAMVVFLLLLAFIPISCSYVYYRKQLKSGVLNKTASIKKQTKQLWILVISGKDTESTKKIYNELTEKISEY